MSAPRVHRLGRPEEPAPRVLGVLVLDAESRWVVESTPEALDAVARDLDPRVWERVAPGVLILQFGNAVGRVERAGALGSLRVHSGKWTEEAYDRLLEELSELAVALPFSASTPTALPYDRVVLARKDLLYHAFVWLRHALLRAGSELGDAMASILRDPHRRMVHHRREVPVERAGRVDARALEQIAMGRRPMRESPLGFWAGGRRVLPIQVEEAYARESVDTPENRFVKFFLEGCLAVVQRVRAVRFDGQAARRVAKDCDALHALLARWRGASLWEEVSEMRYFPAASSVLQGRHAYRVVLRHHGLLQLGSRVPLDADQTHRLLESKDVATLYELWAGFSVMRAVCTRLGPPKRTGELHHTETDASLRRGLLAAWSDGTELAYNPSYTRSPGFHGSSRSLLLRPDVALFVPAGPNAGLHLFDAKFRLDRQDQERFLSEDLHKMHAYRDAIPAARSAWVLYPGTEAVAYFDDGGPHREAFTPLDGVGALPLQPGTPHRALTRLLNAALGMTHDGP